MRPRASKEQWEELMAEVSTARDKDAREGGKGGSAVVVGVGIAVGGAGGQAGLGGKPGAGGHALVIGAPRDVDPFRADEQASQAFIDSAALTPEQTQIPSLLNLLRGVAASLRKRDCTTAELCQELIKADVEENLK